MRMCHYYPYRNADGTVNPDFDENSGRILDLKEGKEIGLNYFYNWIRTYIKEDVTICTVPSSNSDNSNSGIRQLGQRLAKDNRVDATHCLNRHTSVRKAAHGGPRNLEVHFDSINVLDTNLILNNKILLLDDITTSGSSLRACQSILLKAGASNVFMLVLGSTKR